MWTCDKEDRPVVSSIRVDGSDACDCESCKRHTLVQRAIGSADAGASILADVLRYLDPNDWNDVAEGRRLVELNRQIFSMMQDELRQAVGDRPLKTKH